MRFDKCLILAASMAGALACSASAQAQDACIGSLMLFGGPYCPRNYVEADGRTLDIGSNSALYSLFGTTYGGNGSTNFGVPDLRGRAPVGQGQGPNLPNYAQGQLAGSQTTTIQQPNLPPFSPKVNAISGAPNSPVPTGRLLATASSQIYANSGTSVQMAQDMISPLGNGVPMTTQSPIQAIRWCVAVQGIYCSRP